MRNSHIGASYLGDSNALWLQDWGVARRRLAKLRASLVSKRDILRQLCAQEFGHSSKLTRTIRVHLGALRSQVRWKIETVEAAQDTLRAANALFLACISLQAAAYSNEANHGALVELISN